MSDDRCHLFDKRSEALTASQPKTRTTVSQGAWGVEGTRGTFKRVMSSVVLLDSQKKTWRHHMVQQLVDVSVGNEAQSFFLSLPASEQQHPSSFFSFRSIRFLPFSLAIHSPSISSPSHPLTPFPYSLTRHGDWISRLLPVWSDCWFLKFVFEHIISVVNSDIQKGNFILSKIIKEGLSEGCDILKRRRRERFKDRGTKINRCLNTNSTTIMYAANN